MLRTSVPLIGALGLSAVTMIFAESRSERLSRLFKSVGALGVVWFFTNAIGFAFGLFTQEVVAFGKYSSFSVQFQDNPALFLLVMLVHSVFTIWALVALWSALR